MSVMQLDNSACRLFRQAKGTAGGTKLERSKCDQLFVFGGSFTRDKTMWSPGNISHLQQEHGHAERARRDAPQGHAERASRMALRPG